MTTYQRACKYHLGRNPAEINEKRQYWLTNSLHREEKTYFFTLRLARD